MRAVMAIAAAVLVLVTTVAPHAHDGVLGSHACAACVSSGATAAVHQTPGVAPLAAPPEALPQRSTGVSQPGFPLGAVPGQSPPSA